MKRKFYFIVLTILSVQVYSQKVYHLEECRQMALLYNKNVQMVKENLNAATELKNAAFTQFLPNFSANATYLWNQKSISLLSEDKYLPVYNFDANGVKNYANSWNNKWAAMGDKYVPLDNTGKPFDPQKNPEKIQWKNMAYLPKSAMEFDMHSVFAGTIGFVQPIFMGGKIRELYRIAGYGENLAKAQMEDSETNLLEEVDEAYWRIVSVESKVLLARDYRDLIARLDSNVAIMIEEGVATKAEALKLKVKLNEAEVSLTKAENGLQLSKMALSQLCGLPLESTYSLEDTDLEKGVDVNLIPTEQALSNRPEIKALLQVENIAKANERLMFSRYLPNIALSGNYLVSNPNTFNGFSKDFAGMFTVGLVANVPLYHFGDKLHTLNAAKSQSRVAALKLEEAREKMQLQIKQNAFRLAESQKKKITTKRNIEQAEENLRYATEGFEAGVITSTDLLAAQTAWVSAKSEHIDAKIDVRLCNVYLAKSLGLLNTSDATFHSVNK